MPNPNWYQKKDNVIKMGAAPSSMVYQPMQPVPQPVEQTMITSMNVRVTGPSSVAGYAIPGIVAGVSRGNPFWPRPGVQVEINQNQCAGLTTKMPDLQINDAYYNLNIPDKVCMQSVSVPGDHAVRGLSLQVLQQVGIDVGRCHAMGANAAGMPGTQYRKEDQLWDLFQDPRNFIAHRDGKFMYRHLATKTVVQPISTQLSGFAHQDIPFFQGVREEANGDQIIGTFLISHPNTKSNQFDLGRGQAVQTTVNNVVYQKSNFVYKDCIKFINNQSLEDLTSDKFFNPQSYDFSGWFLDNDWWRLSVIETENSPAFMTEQWISWFAYFLAKRSEGLYQKQEVLENHMVDYVLRPNTCYTIVIQLADGQDLFLQVWQDQPLYDVVMDNDHKRGYARWSNVGLVQCKLTERQKVMSADSGHPMLITFILSEVQRIVLQLQQQKKVVSNIFVQNVNRASFGAPNQAEVNAGYDYNKIVVEHPPIETVTEEGFDEVYKTSCNIPPVDNYNLLKQNSVFQVSPPSFEFCEDGLLGVAKGNTRFTHMVPYETRVQQGVEEMQVVISGVSGNRESVGVHNLLVNANEFEADIKAFGYEICQAHKSADQAVPTCDDSVIPELKPGWLQHYPWNSCVFSLPKGMVIEWTTSSQE